MYPVHRYETLQLYLDDEIAKVLRTVSRQTGTTISSLVRDCVWEKFGRQAASDKSSMAKEIGGIWRDRKDLGTTARYVRNLRKGRRLRNLAVGKAR
jgi:hypothetical protein